MYTADCFIYIYILHVITYLCVCYSPNDDYYSLDLAAKRIAHFYDSLMVC